jgi:hypothetical protein
MSVQYQDPDRLIQRLESLERRYRQVKWSGLVALTTLVVWLAFLNSPPGGGPEAPSHDLEVRSVVLRDEDGNQRATLTMLDSGPGLSLYGPQGETQAVLAVGEQGPYLHLFDQNRKLRLALTAAERGANISLYDERGTPGAWMLLARGIPSLGLQGKSWSTLELHSVGEGVGLTMGARKGPRSSQASLEFQGGWPSLHLLSEEGKSRTYRP